MLRTRIIREAASYFQDADPQACLTETTICTLFCTGAVLSARVEVSRLMIKALDAAETFNSRINGRLSEGRAVD